MGSTSTPRSKGWSGEISPPGGPIGVSQLGQEESPWYRRATIARYGGGVTAVTQTPVIDQALQVIDDELVRLASRDMVTATDVTNLLLDLRVLLAPAATPITPEPVNV